MLGQNLEMACTQFHENWLIIDGDIDEKHALQIYQIIVSWTIVKFMYFVYVCAII